jgi:hypothetical protein
MDPLASPIASLRSKKQLLVQFLSSKGLVNQAKPIHSLHLAFAKGLVVKTTYPARIKPLITYSPAAEQWLCIRSLGTNAYCDTGTYEVSNGTLVSERYSRYTINNTAVSL